ncbi:MAG: DUF4387 domain-containing protein [Clostridiaceae bacterium]|jgi:hypothetical protein|nr:DUF4387 domain-containing protein [Eubacteriales bacterium]NLV48901.1 DUF4387 domain-containing protein [Clostridiaceae bacterium]
MRIKLIDITDVIRSKNAGPYELTFDIMFKSLDWFEKVVAADAINTDTVCRLFQLQPDDVLNIIPFKPAKAIKITIKRPLCSGDLGETDVYGAQQHAPLLSLELNLSV